MMPIRDRPPAWLISLALLLAGMVAGLALIHGPTTRPEPAGPLVSERPRAECGTIIRITIPDDQWTMSRLDREENRFEVTVRFDTDPLGIPPGPRGDSGCIARA